MPPPLLLRLLLLPVLLCGTLCTAQPLVGAANGSAVPVVGFYHVGLREPAAASIVRDQLLALEESGLLAAIAELRIVSLGEASHRALGALLRGTALLRAKARVVLSDDRLQRMEFPTLQLLRQHCAAHPGASVFYVHTKGAFNRHTTQDAHRAGAEHAVVWAWRDCLAHLAHADACGSFYMHAPWPHFSGNMWWARCDHVARLFVPKDGTEVGGRTGALAAGRPYVFGFDDRFEAERWILSAESGVAVDCTAERPHHSFGETRSASWDGLLATLQSGCSCPGVQGRAWGPRGRWDAGAVCAAQTSAAHAALVERWTAHVAALPPPPPPPP